MFYDQFSEAYDPPERDIPSPQELGEPYICPRCHGRRTIQPDPNTPPEECPECVDPDGEDLEPEYRQDPALPHDPQAEADIPVDLADFVTAPCGDESDVPF